MRSINSKQAWMYSLVLLGVLNGCGSDSSTQEVKEISAVFVDAPVAGLSYECDPSARAGVTNSEGRFYCNEGDTASFILGGTILGPVTMENDAVVTPHTLFPNNTDAAINVAQLLQTLDSDGNTTDGVITLDAQQVASLITSDLDPTSTAFETEAQALLDDANLTLVAETVAKAHLEESLGEHNITIPVEVDTVAPVVTLTGDAAMTVAFGSSYTDAGATAEDAVDGVLTPVMSGSVDTSVAATYTITWTATDAAGNAASVSREVTVRANVAEANTVSEPVVTSFASIAVNTAAYNNFTHTEEVTVDGKAYAFTYNALMHSGYRDNGEIFGAVKDVNGDLITFGDGSPYICNGTNAGVGSGLDYTSILKSEDKLYMVSQFECSIGAMYMAELEQDAATGVMTPKPGTLTFIDQSSEFGGWTHCAGMKTPWESHLGSEEYESDARAIEEESSDTYYSEVAKYWGGNAASANPYFYGWVTETKVAAGAPDYTKHYSMGRFSHELAYVMPDLKTAYLSDDGTNVGFYRFVADSEETLRAGTLYAAKFTQTESNKGGAFDIEWVSLGHATDSEIRTMVAAKPVFSDIFETAEPLCADMCPSGFTSINTTHGHECLKVKSGKELMASRLETRRYAAMLGATTEIRKEEGITYDPVHHRLYVAISEVSKGMTDNEKYDQGGSNAITLPNNSCGAVYALDLEKTAETDYSAKNFYAILHGEPKEYGGTEYEGNSCDVNGIANPDNLTYIPNSDTLLIAEDTSAHKNNMVWAYDIEEGTLARIASVPSGAEASGIFWYQNINGFSYLSLVTQHPSSGKESIIGLFSAATGLTPELILPATQTLCEADGNLWNSDLGECFAAVVKPDYTQKASFDNVTTGGSCYSTGDGVVFAADFECALSQPWYIYSASSDLDWEVVNYGSYMMKITGYQADAPSDDWMISPMLSLTGDEVLNFDHALNYTPSVCTVLVSKDYSGQGDPSTATWDTLATYTESNGNWNFYPADAIDLSAYAGEDVHLAFRHTNAVTNKSGTWEIDNVVISGSGSVTVNFQTGFSVSDTAVLTTEYVEFAGSVTGGTSPYSYSWDMGNGSTQTTEHFCYNYPDAGVYEVILSVTDDNGTTVNSETKQITVNTPLDAAVSVNGADLRVATFNAYLNRASEGELYSDLQSGKETQIKNVAHIVQLVKPDVLLLNEFDYNSTANVELLMENYFKVAQGTESGIDYPYYYVAPVNTGVQTGLDVNGDGEITGNDAYGYGDFAGQYGMVVLSKYPIDTANIRTFQKFLWKDMPDAYLPKNANGSDYYTTAVQNIFRLSSKSHWDIPVTVNGKTVHILASHPTPPVFDDGDKEKDNTLIDWNGLRNHDEIRLWADYIAGADYLYDDENVSGGLKGDNRFVMMGDQNADPDEGDSYLNAIMQILEHNLTNASVTPTSLGATSEGANNRENDDTAGWSMRADYVLPSRYGFEVDDCQVFWPELNDVKHYLVEESNSGQNSSDHRLVWCDLNLTDTNSTAGQSVAPVEPVTALTMDFEKSGFENWSTVSFSSSYDWEIANYGSYMAKMAAHKDKSNTADDWMISPEISFVSGQSLSFDHVLNYSGSTCKVMVSTDYDGLGDPTSANWTTVATYTESMESWNLRAADSIDLSSYAGSNGYVAFHYTNAVAGTAGTWEIDNIVISD